jgi:hypothetical protein
LKYNLIFVSLGSCPLFFLLPLLCLPQVFLYLLLEVALSVPPPASKRYSLVYRKYLLLLFLFHAELQICPLLIISVLLLSCIAILPVQHSHNLLNWLLTLHFFIMSNSSSSCIQNDHASCDGIVKTILHGSEITEMCACQCHNSSYQLTKKMFGLINQKD